MYKVICMACQDNLELSEDDIQILAKSDDEHVAGIWFKYICPKCKQWQTAMIMKKEDK